MIKWERGTVLLFLPLLRTYTGTQTGNGYTVRVILYAHSAFADFQRDQQGQLSGTDGQGTATCFKLPETVTQYR